jgi:hypothetical protein
MYVQRPSMGILMFQKPFTEFLCVYYLIKILEAFYRLMLD